MSASGLANAVAVTDSVIAPEHLLGWLATYTLPDEERSGGQLMRVWANNGLDVDDLPEARQPVHVFQSACASVNTRGRDSNGKVEIRADEIENNGACRYQITLKTWDLTNKSIEHEKAMRVTFDKISNAITVDFLGAGRDARLVELEDRIRKHFDANAKTVPGQKIRNAIRLKLQSIGAQNLRRKAGGLYFVPRQATVRQGTITQQVDTRPILDGLKGVLADLYGERADFYIIPLANDEGAQAMVRKHFKLNVTDELRDLTEETIQRVRIGKGRGVREERIVNLVQKRRRIGAAIQQFEDLVAVEQKDLSANLRDLDKAIADLQALADS